MAWNDGLDPNTAAYQIAADDSACVCVLAGPGTGKSYAIKRRITRLLEEGENPKKILAVTFTRMSAADLVRDIRSLEVAGADGVRASTLHSECFRILGNNAVIEITGRHPRSLAAFEFEPMLADLRSSASGRGKKAMRTLIAAYESAWARLQHENPGRPLTQEDIKFEEALVDWLKFHRAMLIGELVPFAYKFMRDNPAAQELSKYSHVLVDEYQDLNKAEQEVAAQLAKNGHLIVVGDDDQSIYTFKNAHRIGIIEFPNDHPGTKNHTMDDCQRCPRLVISLANSIIAKNKTRPMPARKLKPIAKNGEGTVEVVHFKQLADEIKYIKERICQFIDVGIPPGQIIVLCQTRQYIRGLYEMLQNDNIPCEFCYQESQFDEEHAMEKMALLCLIGDNEDRVSLRYLVGLGSSNWRTAQWTKIQEASVLEGKSPWNILEECRQGERTMTGIKQVLERFNDISAQVSTLSALCGDELLQAWIPVGSKCAALRTLAEEVIQSDVDCDAKKLAEKVRERVVEPEIPDEVPDVRIMSLHKSKGLSANVVIIAGCVEGVLPRQREKDMTDAQYAEAIEEHRRLFFVGLTRVKAAPTSGRPGQLIITASQQIPLPIAMKGIAIAKKTGTTAWTITSRFLDEMGPDSPTPKRIDG